MTPDAMPSYLWRQHEVDAGGSTHADGADRLCAAREGDLAVDESGETASAMAMATTAGRSAIRILMVISIGSCLRPPCLQPLSHIYRFLDYKGLSNFLVWS